MQPQPQPYAVDHSGFQPQIGALPIKLVNIPSHFMSSASTTDVQLYLVWLLDKQQIHTCTLVPATALMIGTIQHTTLVNWDIQLRGRLSLLTPRTS